MTITLDDARAEPSLRQAFLDGLDLGDLRFRINDLHHAREDDASNLHADIVAAIYKQQSLATTILTAEEHPSIVVTDIMFNTPAITSIDDVLSAIYDHEGTHVDQYLDALHRRNILRLRVFITARQIAAPDYGKYAVVDKNEACERERDITSLMDDMMHMLDEIPAFAAQHTGKYATRISPTVRTWTAHVMTAYERALAIIDEKADNASQDIFTDPHVCFKKLYNAPYLHQEVDEFLLRQNETCMEILSR
ncbi:TPA: hypothetical protein HA251_04570 [Candidatus Woesearchaeota archaeon]|nr:hypothetical protein [Candidatus Woesearchaeota archaeon]